MALDKLVDSAQLDSDLEEVADAIRAAGGSSADLSFPAGFKSAIQALAGGGGGGGGIVEVEASDVNFYDDAGNIVAAYTAAEFALLEAMPANPERAGLIAQGWNWTLSDAQAHVAAYGMLDVGQMYITDDGATRIYIHLPKGRISPRLAIAVNGSADVDWGDNSTPTTLTGNSLTTPVDAVHSYASDGDYCISIMPASGSTFAIVGDQNYGTFLLGKDAPSSQSYSTMYDSHIYRGAIRRVEIGANCSLGIGCFHSAYNLEAVTVPQELTAFPMHGFYNAYHIKEVTVPPNATFATLSTFSYCYAKAIALPKVMAFGDMRNFESCYLLERLTIPIYAGQYNFNNCYCLTAVILSDDSSIGNYAFNNCKGMVSVTFTKTNPPLVSRSDTLTALPADCIIRVPSGRLAAYQGASNYPSGYTYQEY